MRITSKGQVTIPLDVREQAGLLPGTDIEFLMERGRVIITKAKPGASRKATRGEKLVRQLRNAKGYNGMTTAEIMALTRGD